METKICSTCNKKKPIENFHKAKGYIGGRVGQCRDCLNMMNRKRRKENPEKYRKKNKDWIDRNPELVRANRLKSYKNALEKEGYIVSYSPISNQREVDILIDFSEWWNLNCSNEEVIDTKEISKYLIIISNKYVEN